MDKELYIFFLVIPPGLEDLGALELRKKFDLDCTYIHGGLEVSCTLNYGYFLNRALKIPNRILQRITSFRCRDFPKLFNRIKKIPWNQFLATNNIEFSISSSNSRLFDSRKIEKSASDGIKKYFDANTPPKKIINNKKQTVFLRFHNDELTISVDTSGDRLHLRGYRTHIGPAPLRENIAAALVLALSKYCHQKTALIDPMCGSGTLLIEADKINSLNSMRDFLYPVTNDIPLTNIEIPFSSYHGFDIDQSVIAIAKENTMRANAKINFDFEDLFNKETPTQKQAVICNPPYGKRIKTNKTLNEIFNQIITKYDPLFFAMIILAEEEITIPKRYCLKEKYHFENGGIKVNLVIMTQIASAPN